MIKPEPCPVCKAKATVIRMYDAYDDADFGYMCGCPKGTILDGKHDSGCRAAGYTKTKAIEAWNKEVECFLKRQIH